MTIDRFWCEPKFSGYDEKAAWIIPRLKAQLDTFDFPHDDFWVEVMFCELMIRANGEVPSGNMRRLVRARLDMEDRLPPREPILAKWEARKVARKLARATPIARAPASRGRL